MKVITETFINNIELIDKSEYAEGRTRFWHDLQDFMSQQLHKDVRYFDFSDLDSTRAIGDSLIMVLRQRTAQDIVYQERTGHTLLFLRANYLEGSDTLSATFYMDTQLTGVVAFKHN